MITFREETQLTRILERLVGDFLEPIYQSQSTFAKSQVVPKKTLDKTMGEYIYRDFFLWCVLTHRLEMAKIFLGQMKTRLCSALIASKILKSLAKYAPDHDSNNKICSEADDFETYAIECIRLLAYDSWSHRFLFLFSFSFVLSFFVMRYMCFTM
jgi:hypothetical protein